MKCYTRQKGTKHTAKQLLQHWTSAITDAGHNHFTRCESVPTAGSHNLRPRCCNHPHCKTVRRSHAVLAITVNTPLTTINLLRHTVCVLSTQALHAALPRMHNQTDTNRPWVNAGMASH